MSELVVVMRGVARTGFGKRDDPRRIANIEEGISHASSYRDLLEPRRFEPDESDPEGLGPRRGLAAWPEGEDEREVAVIRSSLSTSFLDYVALYNFVAARTDYEHLLLPWLVVASLWADELYRAGIKWVVAAALDSLLRYDVGHLAMPYYDCTPAPEGRRLAFIGIDNSWGDRPGVLVGCKS